MGKTTNQVTLELYKKKNGKHCAELRCTDRPRSTPELFNTYRRSIGLGGVAYCPFFPSFLKLEFFPCALPEFIIRLDQRIEKNRTRTRERRKKS